MILKESLRGEKQSEQMKQSEKSCEEENKTKDTDTKKKKKNLWKLKKNNDRKRVYVWGRKILCLFCETKIPMLFGKESKVPGTSQVAIMAGASATRGKDWHLLFFFSLSDVSFGVFLTSWGSWLAGWEHVSLFYKWQKVGHVSVGLDFWEFDTWMLSVVFYAGNIYTYISILALWDHRRRFCSCAQVGGSHSHFVVV